MTFVPLGDSVMGSSLYGVRHREYQQSIGVTFVHMPLLQHVNDLCHQGRRLGCRKLQRSMAHTVPAHPSLPLAPFGHVPCFRSVLGWFYVVFWFCTWVHNSAAFLIHPFITLVNVFLSGLLLFGYCSRYTICKQFEWRASILYVLSALLFQWFCRTLFFLISKLFYSRHVCIGFPFYLHLHFVLIISWKQILWLGPS